MNAASGVQVFRPWRARGWMAVVCTVPFLAFGLFGLWTIGGSAGAVAFFGAFLGFGLLGLAVGIATLRTKVTVGPAGITKSSILGGFTVGWSDVESWEVVPTSLDDSFTFREVRVRIRGRSFDLVVYDSEVWRPGFEAFQAALRAAVADREVVVKV
jgi:hypothetical protein